MELREIAKDVGVVLSEGWQEELEEVYAEWRRWTNMTATQLRRWSESPVSKMASVDPAAVIKRNLHLLETPKDQWGAKEVRDAKRTISFNQRMSHAEQGREVRKGIPFSKRDVSLINWAWRPSSIPISRLHAWSGASGRKKVDELDG